MSKTILMGPFCAPNVNVINTELVVGIPSPLAALGFARKFAILLGEDSKGTEQACAIFHSFRMADGRHKPSPTNKSGDDYSNVETPEKITGHTTFSIVVHYPNGLDTNTTKIWETLMRMRFAGSNLFPANQKGQSTGWHNVKPEHHIRHVQDERDLLKSLKHIPQGWMYLPVNEDTNTLVFSDGKNNIHSLLDKIQSAQRANENEKVMLRPTLCGFQFYQECRQPKTESTMARAIVAPLFSHAEQVSSRSLVYKKPNFNLSGDLWGHDTCESRDITFLSPRYKNKKLLAAHFAQQQGDTL